ncbi:hypothetical protein FZEAL_8848 [Fusarium zealandicum]|uniref:Uncharacterized protein n=1 Tax=Fusarium zealandicum TaxID=1053134 RepID=A0A8H4XH30_9HYPO|nr:hypothetical protein FZEAL_8848 [Fusarium zealandicum]
MRLHRLFSVVAFAAAGYAGPCKPRLSTTSSAMTGSDISTATSSSALSITSSITASTESVSTSVTSSEEESTSAVSTAETTIGESTTVEMTIAESTTAKSTITESTTAESTSTVETTTTMVESSTESSTGTSSDISTTTRGVTPIETFSLIISQVSGPSADLDGNVVASAPGSIPQSLRIYAPGTVPAESSTSFYIDPMTGRLISNFGNAFCPLTIFYYEEQKTSALSQCAADSAETSNSFIERRVLTCAQSAEGELECKLQASGGNLINFARVNGRNALEVTKLEPGSEGAERDNLTFFTVKIAPP